MSVNQIDVNAVNKRTKNMKQNNQDSKDEDKWWKVSAYAVAILFFGYFIARTVVTWIFAV